LEIDRKVFGRITVKEIIGAQPPAVPDTRDMLESELGVLLADLDAACGGKHSLLRLLAGQKEASAHVNCRPGAMALAQTKIRLFNEYNDRYMNAIHEKHRLL